MTRLTPLSRNTRSQILLFSLAAVAMLSSTSCEDKHIGRPCDIGVEMVADPKLITINPQALECPSRLCILPAQDKTTNTTAFCTDECSSDDDCADGEKRGSAATDTRCQNGFACRFMIPNLQGNSLACKKVCACADFFMSDDPNKKPESCP